MGLALVLHAMRSDAISMVGIIAMETPIWMRAAFRSSEWKVGARAKRLSPTAAALNRPTLAVLGAQNPDIA